MRYSGGVAACFKRGHSSTPKNAATAKKNAASEPFYGLVFKTGLLLFLKAAFLKNASVVYLGPRFLQPQPKKTRPNTPAFYSVII